MVNLMLEDYGLNAFRHYCSFFKILIPVPYLHGLVPHCVTEILGKAQTTLDISIIGDTVTISGKVEPEILQEGESYHRQERNYGHFKRILQLPFHVNADKVEATYEKGILRISLPKEAEDIPKKITIQSV